MILEDTLEFLKGIPPFQFLEAEHLKKTAGELALEFFPRGTVVLKQNGPPSDCLRIIKKGSVQVLMDAEGGDQVLLEVKGEGDNFGFLSMIGKDRQRTTIKVIEDTLCYRLTQERVLRLVEISPPFNEYFMAYLSRYVDRTYREMHHRSSFYGSSERLLFTTRVGDIAIPHVTIDENATIQEAAQLMSRHKISSLVLQKNSCLPSGFITISDLRDKVVAKGRNVGEPVKNIGSISLIRVDGRDTCFEALLKMIHFNIHHLLVVTEGELAGIVTNHDIMLLQGASPVSFAKDIINQQTIEGLVPLLGKIFNIIGLLLKEEIRFVHLSNIITEIYDRLFRKILEIGEKTFGPPPLPYCLVALGAEGRREHVFKTNHHYALIHSDPQSTESERLAEDYFSTLHDFFCNSLRTLGAPPVISEAKMVMPRWHNPRQEWERMFGEWISHASVDTTTDIRAFFDARPVAGKTMLFQESRARIASQVQGSDRVFLKTLAQLASTPPPAGFTQKMVIERDGSQQATLDLFRRGVVPIIDLVRFFALLVDVRECSTLGRIRAIGVKNAAFGKRAGEVAQSFEFMKMLQIHHQFGQIKSGRAVDSLLRPEHLSNLQKKTLREAFRTISELQALALAACA
jgi:CBS domain-containing protein